MDLHDSRTPLLKDDIDEDILEVASSSSTLEDELDDPVTRDGVERELLWKLDKRMSILVLIYILNFVRITSPVLEKTCLHAVAVDRP